MKTILHLVLDVNVFPQFNEKIKFHTKSLQLFWRAFNVKHLFLNIEQIDEAELLSFASLYSLNTKIHTILHAIFSVFKFNYKTD